MSNQELKYEIKQHIITYTNLMGMTPDDIADDTPLFGEGLGLDSIDSLELVVMLEREYGIKIGSPAEGRKILIDVNHIADYIQTHKDGA